MKKIICLIVILAVSLWLYPVFAGADGWGGPKSRVFRGKTAAPTVNDDLMDGYRIGDIWVDEASNWAYILVDKSVGAADWDPTNRVASGTTFEATQIHDGSVSNIEFGYLDGGTENIQNALDGKESATSNNIDPDRLAGDTTDDNSIDQGIITWWIVDSGVTTADTETIITSAGDYVRVEITAEDDPSGVTVSETNLVHNDIRVIYNSGVSEIQLSSQPTSTGTTQKLPYTVYIAQFESVVLRYQTDRLVLHNGNRRMDIDTINAKSILYSNSGRANTTQLNDLSSIVTLLAKEVAGTFVDCDAQSGLSNYLLPTPEPGMNVRFNLCISGTTIQVTSGETSYVDGTATNPGTGAKQPATGVGSIGEYIDAWVAWDATNAQNCWFIRKQDD